MTAASLSPLRWAGVCLQGAALLFSAALSGCQSPRQALQALASSHGQHLEVLATTPFPLAMIASHKQQNAARLRIYLEGDGHAWATPTQPSIDPSPRQLLVAQLALDDPTPALYLGRPCQFLSVSTCTPEMWTNRRFSEEVIASLDQALDLLKARYRNQDFELVGYSGGAAVALLLAARRDDIAQIQTLAGNLSPTEWVRIHQLSPLRGSLEPLQYRQRLASIPQRHLFGSEDRVIPSAIEGFYRRQLGPAACLETLVIPGVSHETGWNQAWQRWREQPIKCALPAREGTADGAEEGVAGSTSR
ncbi:alpha/beta hydrolase [Pseudomonas alkylphenolica]|jgi:pimeloyl-ACP methyl ester carboxylesterase|uniref:alpha/beta hydrolase n=1 Tax=Pseudomonas alkylphenolica TaxID=237609 RepID=UPI001E2C8135|nr:alpha/beta hydrolase [Pseudomonas alkylphenolica]